MASSRVCASGSMRTRADRACRRDAVFVCCRSALSKAWTPSGPIAWRAADSFALREFLGLVLPEAPPDHSTLSRTHRLIDLETHEAVFTWMLQRRRSPRHVLRCIAIVGAFVARGACGCCGPWRTLGAALRASLQDGRQAPRAPCAAHEPSEATADPHGRLQSWAPHAAADFLRHSAWPAGAAQRGRGRAFSG